MLYGSIGALEVRKGKKEVLPKMVPWFLNYQGIIGCELFVLVTRRVLVLYYFCTFWESDNFKP